MASFPSPRVRVNSQGWGPTSDNVPDKFRDVPFAPFSKGDLGKSYRAADFSSAAIYARAPAKFRQGRGQDELVQNKELQYYYDPTEDDSFQLVDTSKTPNPNRRNNQPARQRHDNRRNDRRQRFNRIERQASVKVQADWDVIEEFDIAQLLKLQANRPVAEDLKWCGFLDPYEDAWDSVSSRTAKPLVRMEDKEFYSVTTTDDPVIEELAVECAGNVYATDAILAHLMACPRSVQPWDLVVQKVNDLLFFDKRDDSQFDYLTVSETASDPPQTGEDPESINDPAKLSLEASGINQNFSQQILKSRGEGRQTMEFPNPFYSQEDSPGMEPAAVAYRYRKFTLGDIQLVARCELHGTVVKKGTKQFMTAFALNEWDSSKSGGVEWRRKIDNQRGAVFATELKNNSAKLAKWTAQSVISGAEQMKIGFVSRKRPTDNQRHEILATQFYKPQEFANQITLNVLNMWGIIKMFAEKFMSVEDGKYVIMKDPNKPTVRIYSVPPDTFEDGEDEEDEGEDEDGEGAEEEGGTAAEE